MRKRIGNDVKFLVTLHHKKNKEYHLLILPYTLEEVQNIINSKNEPEQPYTGDIPHYVVLQVVLKEALIGTGSQNLSELEVIINRQAAKGYRLHTMSTTSSGSSGVGGGDRIQATLVFEKLR